MSLFEKEEKTGDDRFKTYDNDACHGVKAPAVDTLKYLTGEERGTAKLGDKPIVLLFWGKYQEQSFKFLPTYSKLAAKFEGKVQFVAVSMDPEESYPQKFLDDPAKKYSTVFPVDFAVAWDEGKKVAPEYEMAQRGTLLPPHAFVVNAEGNIVWHQDHSEIGSNAPSYLYLMEQQLDNLVAGKELEKVGEREVSDSDSDDGEEVVLGDGEGFDLF